MLQNTLTKFMLIAVLTCALSSTACAIHHKKADEEDSAPRKYNLRQTKKRLDRKRSLGELQMPAASSVPSAIEDFPSTLSDVPTSDDGLSSPERDPIPAYIAPPAGDLISQQRLSSPRFNALHVTPDATIPTVATPRKPWVCRRSARALFGEAARSAAAGPSELDSFASPFAPNEHSFLSAGGIETLALRSAAPVDPLAEAVRAFLEEEIPSESIMPMLSPNTSDLSLGGGESTSDSDNDDASFFASSRHSGVSIAFHEMPLEEEEDGEDDDSFEDPDDSWDIASHGVWSPGRTHWTATPEYIDAEGQSRVYTPSYDEEEEDEDDDIALGATPLKRARVGN